MAIENIPLTPTQFDYLQQNISDQADIVEGAVDLAQSGLRYVVLLQVDAPEVDLVNPFHDHLVGIDNLNSDSTYTAIVSDMNNHVVNRGTTAGPSDTVNSRLNRWLSDNGVTVTQTYARISSGAGFIIDSGNIDP